MLIPGTRPYRCREHYISYIDAIAKKIGLKEKVELEFYETFRDHCNVQYTPKNGSQHVIKLNLSFLVSAKDVPKPFLLQSMNDPKIYQKSFMKQVVSWINRHFGIEHDSSQLDPKEKEGIVLLLFRANQPQLLEKSRKWEIVQLMASFRLEHGKARRQFHTAGVKTVWRCTLFAISIFAGNYAVGYVTQSSAPFHPATIFSLVCMAAGISLVSNTCLFSETCKNQAFESDAFAVKALQQKSGALYCLQTRMSWKQKLHPDQEDEPGDALLGLTFNPTASQRITEIQKLAINEDE